jgi:ribonuclease HI
MVRMPDPMAYTDGACLGNPGPGGWGVRILYPDGSVREYGGAAAATTNNRMELQAAIEALKVLATCPEATVVTDSRYVIDGLTRWIHNWRRRGWTTLAHTPVKNRGLWMTLDRLNHPHIVWQHVRGHSGDPNNERVDAIARAFARGTATPLFCGQSGAPGDPVVTPSGNASPVIPLPTLSERSASSPGATASAQGSRAALPKARYISIVHGVVALDDEWAACAARVRGASGARYKKVRTAEELASFCAEHGVAPPQLDCEGG